MCNEPHNDIDNEMHHIMPNMSGHRWRNQHVRTPTPATACTARTTASTQCEPRLHSGPAPTQAALLPDVPGLILSQHHTGPERARARLQCQESGAPIGPTDHSNNYSAPGRSARWQRRCPTMNSVDSASHHVELHTSSSAHVSTRLSELDGTPRNSSVGVRTRQRHLGQPRCGLQFAQPRNDRL